jgi:hypothetical protein
MKRFIRKLIWGTDVIKEYSTIQIDTIIKEKVFLENGAQLLDVSKDQLLLCLEPIVFGIWLDNKDAKLHIDKKKDFRLRFTSSTSQANDILLAKAVFTYVTEIVEDEGIFLIIQLKRSKIYLLSSLKVLLLYYKYYRKPGLSFRKLKSLVCAYSYPRKVRIVSYTNPDYYNIFPMDLLGEVGSNRFAFGLRHSNKSLSKIIDDKRIVASEVSSAYKQTIYQLGTHHGSSPPALMDLPFLTMQSEQWSFHIPEWVLGYKEIKIKKVINLGSHMLLWGIYDKEVQLKKSEPNLYHIHFLLDLNKIKTNSCYTAV